MNAPAFSGARAVHGRLELKVVKDALGRSVLTHRHASGGFHLSKPYWDGEVLLTQWINPTAGIFAGDRLSSRIHVSSGARLLLTTPSATRIHERPFRALPPGLQDQHFKIEKNGFLEMHPEFLIPQRNSAFVQRTEICLESGSALLFAEMLAPGRLASGEQLAWDSLDLRLQVRMNDRLLIQERLNSNLESSHWRMRSSDGCCLFTGTVVVAAPSTHAKLPNHLRDSLSRCEHCNWGMSQLDESVWTIRVASPDGIRIRRLMHALRRELFALDPRFGRPLRKL